MPDRRTFLKTTAAASVLSLAPGVHAGGSDELRVGLVGCGGRGSGAAKQAANAASGVKITALADAFPERLSECKKDLKNSLVPLLDHAQLPKHERECHASSEATASHIKRSLTE